jgi:hypothetical protein
MYITAETEIRINSTPEMIWDYNCWRGTGRLTRGKSGHGQQDFRKPSRREGKQNGNEFSLLTTVLLHDSDRIRDDSVYLAKRLFEMPGKRIRCINH